MLDYCLFKSKKKSILCCRRSVARIQCHPAISQSEIATWRFKGLITPQSNPGGEACKLWIDKAKLLSSEWTSTAKLASWPEILCISLESQRGSYSMADGYGYALHWQGNVFENCLEAVERFKWQPAELCRSISRIQFVQVTYRNARSDCKQGLLIKSARLKMWAWASAWGTTASSGLVWSFQSSQKQLLIVNHCPSWIGNRNMCPSWSSKCVKMYYMGVWWLWLISMYSGSI